MSWPDRNRSKQYLEEVLENNPGSLRAKFFLANTLYDMGSKERERALDYYRDVLSAEPRENINYFRDKKIISDCRQRVNQLGILTSIYK